MQGIKEALTQNLSAIDQVKSSAHSLESLGSELQQLIQLAKV
jgi:methyl-accepting chemotaxis protein